MKKIISIMLALLLVLTFFTGCVDRKQDPNHGLSTSPPNNSGNKDVFHFYNSEDNPSTIVRRSTPPNGFPETAVSNTLTIAKNGEPHTLFPLEGNQSAAVKCEIPMYENLIRYNTFTNKFEPRLAESWKMIDEKTIRIHLRKGVKCHAGYEITTDDVLWTIQMGQQCTASAYLWGTFDLENTKIIDKYTIDIATPEPFGPILSYLGDTSTGYIINRQAYEEVDPEYYARHPTGGTGPYMFVDWVPGDRVIYKRFEDYWGEKPYYQNLIIRNIADNVTRTMSLEAGEVDFAFDIDKASYDSLVDSQLVNVVELPSYRLIKMSLNNRIAPFDDVKVRKAIRYALDLDSIVNIAYNGLAEVADSCWPNALSVYEPAPEELAYKYNPEKAKELLKAAGYDENNPLTFDLWVANVMEWVQLADMIQNALRVIGVTANVIPMDQAMMVDKINAGTYQAEISRFSCSADEADFWLSRLSSGQSYYYNRCQYKNEEVDRLFLEARYSLNNEYRTECYKKIQKYFREDLPWISLACPKLIHGIRSTLDGVEPHPYGTTDIRYIHPINP